MRLSEGRLALECVHRHRARLAHRAPQYLAREQLQWPQLQWGLGSAQAAQPAGAGHVRGAANLEKQYRHGHMTALVEAEWDHVMESILGDQVADMDDI